MFDKLDLTRRWRSNGSLGDAGDFTFVFVGTFSPDTIKPLVEKYIASLPSNGRKETWKDRHVVRRRPSWNAASRRASNRKATRASCSPDRLSTTRSSARDSRVASILQTRLREILREEMGGTYSVSASAS
jgi:zinc protease